MLETVKYLTRYNSMEKIIVNRVKCKHCGDIITSKHRHDYQMCKCGKVSVDGGTAYLRRGFQTSPDTDYEEMSEVQKD